MREGVIQMVIAALGGHTGTVEVILAHSTSTLNAKTNTGATPLVMCAQHGHVETVKLLIAKGCDVTLMDAFGSTPWQIAMNSRNPRGVECAKLIEEAGGKGDGQLRPGPVMLVANEGLNIRRRSDGSVSIEGKVSENPFTILK